VRVDTFLSHPLFRYSFGGAHPAARPKPCHALVHVLFVPSISDLVIFYEDASESKKAGDSIWAFNKQSHKTVKLLGTREG
jgi:hypothetical protein